MDSPRAFFLDTGPEGCGERDRGVGELRDTDENGRGSTVGASAAILSPVGVIGIVGLSGRGVLLHRLPNLCAGGTPRR